MEAELRARGVEEELCVGFGQIAIRRRVDAQDLVRSIEARILASAASAASAEQTSPVGLETGRTSPFEEALDDPAIVVQGPARVATVGLLELLAIRGDSVSPTNSEDSVAWPSPVIRTFEEYFQIPPSDEWRRQVEDWILFEAQEEEGVNHN